jgi:putative transposase
MSPTHYALEGHIHYLTFSCYSKLWLFKSPELYSIFLKHLAEAREKLGFKLYGYIVMPNHVHLLLYPGLDVTVSRVLWAVKRPFAYCALGYLQNRQPELYGKLEVFKGAKETHRFWQAGGGYDRNIFRDETFVHSLEYMHLNPVRKMLVKSPLDWKWSSAEFYKTRKAGLIAVDWPEWW